MRITSTARDTFHARGLLLLAGFLPPTLIAPARDVVLRALERRGLWQRDTWCLDQMERSSSVIAGANLVKGIGKSRAFREVITPELREAVTELVDDRPVFPMLDRPQLLFTLPNAEHWTVPHSIWHLDLPRLPDAGIPGVQVFTLLDAVAPGAGGTLLVAGSHRLLNSGEFIRSRDVKRRLKREPYFRDLMSKHVPHRERFMNTRGQVGDVELQVVELHGKAGDVYLVDMRVLHTLAPNASRVPRMMLTQRFLLEALRERILGKPPKPH